MNIMEKRKKYSVVNLFTKHPRENANETWWQHLKFATHIGFRLFFTSFYFIIHGFFPFIKIPEWINISCTAKYLLNENKKRENNGKNME